MRWGHVPYQTLHGRLCFRKLAGKRRGLPMNEEWHGLWLLVLREHIWLNPNVCRVYEPDEPAITSVTYCTKIIMRSCNILTAERWVCKCDSTGNDKRRLLLARFMTLTTGPTTPSTRCPIDSDTFCLSGFDSKRNFDKHGTRLALS